VSATLPKQERRVWWLNRNEREGYGLLFLAVWTPKGWREQEYFAIPVRGRMGRVWTLAKLVEGVGIEAEYTVNLIAASCTCEDFGRCNRCEHHSALQQLDHMGRL
jgi:hypothetical protein